MNAAFNTATSNAGTRAVVVGLGKSGFSATRYLLAHGFEVAVTDSRSEAARVAAAQGPGA